MGNFEFIPRFVSNKNTRFPEWAGDVTVTVQKYRATSCP